MRSEAMKRYACFMAVIIGLSASQVFAITSTDVTQAIRDKGARWTATKTPVDPQLGGGVWQIENLISEWIDTDDPTESSVVLPSSLSWQAWMSPIKNQGYCGSCVVMTIVGAMEGLYNLYYGLVALDLSEQSVLDCVTHDICEWGWTYDSGLLWALAVGVMHEQDAPYQYPAGMCIASVPRMDCDALSDPAVDLYYVTAYGRITPSKSKSATRRRIKIRLQDGPVLASFRVYQDFYYYQSGVYEHVTGVYAGSHGIVIVGYDDHKKAWLIRNSWGPKFGEAGYAWIKYGAVGIEQNVWWLKV
jgi:C1A family cysteine protease